MQVKAEQTGPCEIELRVEIGAETVTETIDKVFRELSKSTNVPGFRKGKVPRYILERFVSPEVVRRRAIEIMLPPAYKKALEQESIEPIGEPDVEVVQLAEEQPFIFTAKVPLSPKVELGEYRGIEVKREVPQITDEDVEAGLRELQIRQATTTMVKDRGVKLGDLVGMKLAYSPEEEPLPEAKDTLVEIGTNLPQFDEHILGMMPGQRRVFVIKYPEDYPDEKFAGSSIKFDVTVQSIAERHLPEINDDFARKVADCNTVEELKQFVKDQITKAAEEEADKQVEYRILEEILARSQVDFPEVMLQRQMDLEIDDLRMRVENRGLTLEEYLRRSGKTPEEFAAEVRASAENYLRVGLLLGNIAEAEGITVTNEEVEAEIQSIAERMNTTLPAVESLIEKEGGRESLKKRMVARKVREFLKNSAHIVESKN